MDKKRFLFETILTVIIFVVAIVFFYPKEKSTGSSDKLVLSVGNTDNFFEIDIDNIKLGVMTNKEKVNTLIFFNTDSLLFYNKNIENSAIDVGIKKIINIFKENNYFKDNCSINIIRYKGKYNINEIFKYNSLCVYSEKEVSIEDLANEYEISSMDESTILQEIYIMSKDLVRLQNINGEKYKSRSDYVYEKLLKYVDENNIINEDKNSHSLDIILVPVSEEANNYPTNNSYYYVEDGDVYAYIELNIDENIYSYCYNGSIEEYRMGKC